MSREERSIHTGGGAFVAAPVKTGGGDFVGRDKITIYQGPAYARPNYRSDISDILTFYTANFVGRTQEQAGLVAFAGQQRPGYRLLKALPGYGKSALMAQLIHLQETGRWEGEAKTHLLYYFVRQQGGNNTPERFLQAINAQLLDLCDLSGGVPPERNALSSQFSQLWAMAVRAASAQAPVLLLVDGLDEMARGEVTIADLLPANLAPYVHVIVTSRPHPDPMEEVRLEHPLRKAEVRWLQAFDLENVEDLLLEYGASTEVTKHLAPRVLSATQGQPLFARFVSQDVAAEGEAVLAQLEADPPAGVEAYFEQQFRQLDETAEADLTWNILGLMVVALGGLSADELAGVLQMGKRRVRKALDPVRRYLLGEERLSLMHEQLRGPVAEEFSEGEQGALRQQLLAYCARWQEHHSAYALAHYAEHLVEAGQRGELHALIDKPWMEAQFERTFSHRAFAGDVDLAIAAAGEEPIHWVQLVRGSLILVTLGMLATNVPPQVLGVLAQVGRVDRALGYASLMQHAHWQSEAYRLIGEALLVRGESTEAKKVLDWALQAAARTQEEKVSAQALGEISLALARTGESDRALRVAEGIRDGLHKAKALSAVAEVLVLAGAQERAAEAAGQALQAAEGIRDESSRVRALSVVALALNRAGEQECAVEVANRALRVAEVIESERFKRVALSDVAQALAEVNARAGLEQAMLAAEGLRDESSRAWALSEVAQALARAGEQEHAVEAARQAFWVVKGIEGDRLKGKVLSDVARALAQVGESDLALRVLEGIGGEPSKARALSEMAQAFVQAGAQEQAGAVARQALQLSEEIEDDWSRSWVLSEVALALAQVGAFDLALRAAAGIGDEEDRVNALSALAQSLVRAEEPGRAAEAASRALQASDGIRDRGSRVRALSRAALALVQAGEHEHAAMAARQALRAAESIGDEPSKSRALSGIAQALAQAGEQKRAAEVARQAWKLATGTANRSENADVLSGVAQALAWVGEFGQALQVVERVEDEYSRAQAQGELVRALARTGEFDQASRVAWAIGNEYCKAEAVSEVALALAQVGEFDSAVRAVAGMGDNYSKARALSGVALALARAGEHGRAAEVAKQALWTVERIEKVLSKPKLLGEVTLAMSLSGDAEGLSRALGAAAGIQNQTWQAQALSEVALALAQAGEQGRAAEVAGQARRVAEGSGDPWSEARVLSGVARALLRAGERAGAVEVARQVLRASEEIVDPWSKVRSLSGVALVLAQAGQPRWAADTVGQALRVAETIESKQSRTWVLSGEALALADGGQGALAQQMLNTAMATARLTGRDGVFAVLEHGAPVLAVIDQGETLWRVYQAIQEVDSWWSAG